MDKSALYDRLMKLIFERNGSITVNSAGYLVVQIKEFRWFFTSSELTVANLLNCQIRLEAYLLKEYND
jgi:hypothetical protein